MRLIAIVTAAAGLLAAGDHHEMPAGVEQRMLNNEGLVVLARAGYNERFLAELIKTQPTRFDTSVEGLVYLAKQGISERIVRLVLAEQTRERETKLAERTRESESDEPLFQPQSHPQAAPAPAAPAKPVRLRMVNQKVLVPEKPSNAVAPNAMIVVERRALGDRYWAVPAGPQVSATPVVYR